jgi:hypothetical protein
MRIRNECARSYHTKSKDRTASFLKKHPNSRKLSIGARTGKGDHSRCGTRLAHCYQLLVYCLPVAEPLGIPADQELEQAVT